jgi:hypothetical protein
MSTSTGTGLLRLVSTADLVRSSVIGKLPYQSSDPKIQEFYHFDDQICRITVRQLVMSRKTGADE